MNYPVTGSLKGLCFYSKKDLAIFEQLSLVGCGFPEGASEGHMTDTVLANWINVTCTVNCSL